MGAIYRRSLGQQLLCTYKLYIGPDRLGLRGVNPNDSTAPSTVGYATVRLRHWIFGDHLISVKKLEVFDLMMSIVYHK